MGKCFLLHGNDTSAHSSATAGATATITFDATYPPTDYLLDFSSNSDNSFFSAELKDGAGNVIPLRRGDGDPAILRGKPGAVYYLQMTLPVTATDKGGCCSNEQSGSATISAAIRIQRAPILDAKSKVFPLLVGATETSAYPYVGAILLGNKLHCTGTLVGKGTVLTAAHCIFEFEDRLVSSGKFVLGGNITQPTSPPIQVTGSDFPKTAPYEYDPTNYNNDVGLIFIEPTDVVKPVLLHAGEPRWKEFIERKTNLTFVGYGYDVKEEQKVGLGVKREAAWFMEAFDERTVSFKTTSKNTCQGDSGGPAFFIGPVNLIQVAITSGTYRDDCLGGGIESRVDYYLPWISGRIK